MRPVTKGACPQARDFADYRDAKVYLIARLGSYCSFCERRIPTLLAVEHIQPKGLPQYGHLVGNWDNFLLACVNCNSTKGDKDVPLDRHYLPDRDNTFAAFAYQPHGTVTPHQPADQIAANTLSLTGMDKPIRQTHDENGKLVAMDRIADRMTVWGTAKASKALLAAAPTEEMRRQVLLTAIGHGFFSVWMKVFDDDPIMRRMIVEGYTHNGEFRGFPGTAKDCFDANMVPVSPRPANGLGGGSKI